MKIFLSLLVSCTLALALAACSRMTRDEGLLVSVMLLRNWDGGVGAEIGATALFPSMRACEAVLARNNGPKRMNSPGLEYSPQLGAPVGSIVTVYMCVNLEESIK